MKSIRTFATAALALTVIATTSEARAELVLSQLVVDLQPDKLVRQDIEVMNTGSETIYVAVEPREVVGAGLSQSSSRQDPDPEKLGLLVSPARMVLDPGMRKLLRVATLDRSLERERVFRVTVKPVVAQLSSEKAGLKVLVGYDVLILVRPAAPKIVVNGTRSGKVLMLRNEGNTSVELTSGEQCDQTGKNCQDLPGGRLYAGAVRSVPIDPARPVSYMVKVREQFIARQF